MKTFTPGWEQVYIAFCFNAFSDYLFRQVIRYFSHLSVPTPALVRRNSD